MTAVAVAASLVAGTSLLMLGGWIMPVTGIASDLVAAMFALSMSTAFLSIESIDS